MQPSEFWSSFWAQTLLRGMGWLLLIALTARLLRRASAARRALIWQMAFAGLILLPPLLLLLPPLPLMHAPLLATPAVTAKQPLPAATLSQGQSPYRMSSTPSIASHTQVLPALPAADAPAAPFPAVIARKRPPAISPGFLLAKVRGLLFLGWSVGAAWSLLSLVFSMFAVRRLGRCTVAVSPDLIKEKREIADLLGLRRRIALQMAAPENGLHAPITWGLVRPVVMMPSAYAGETPVRCRAALLHELAHIKRSDWAWLLFAQMVCALYWCLPFVWLAARQLCRETEMACDDCVLANGGSAPDYAAQILEVARIMKTRSARLPISAMTMARPPLAPVRIRAILDPRCHRQPVSRRIVALAALLPALVVPVLALRAIAASEARVRPLFSSVPPETALPMPPALEATFTPALADLHAAATKPSLHGPSLRAARPDNNALAEPQTAVDTQKPGTGMSQQSPKEKPIYWGVSRAENGFQFQLGARIVQDRSIFKIGDVVKFQPFGRNLSDRDLSLSVGNYWKVNYVVQVQTDDGKPIYMKRDAHNQAMLVAGYIGFTLGKGATQEISEARLKIAGESQPQKPGTVNMDEDEWVEAVALKPGRYRVRLLSWGVAQMGKTSRTEEGAVATGWIPIEIKAK